MTDTTAISVKMMIYELITPSDPITFLASDHKVALCAAILLGEGKAGVTCLDDRDAKIPALCFLMEEPLPMLAEYLGQELDAYIGAHKAAVADSLLSFAYGDAEARRSFDDACAAITDREKLAAFKAKHEDRNRTSMSQWVKSAWKMGAALRKQLD